MGIVQKQTIRGTIWSYLGAALGFVNIILLSPKIFTAGQIGVVQLLISFAAIMAQFSGLGFINVINRLFPYFRKGRGDHNGFLALALTITLAGFIITLVFLRFYQGHFVAANAERSPLISEYAFYLPALLLVTLLFNLLDNYNKVLYDAVLGTFTKEFLFRVFNLMLICLFWAGVIDFDGYVLGYVVSQGVPMIIIFVSLLLRGEISLKFDRGFITPHLRREIFFLSLFGILSGVSGLVLTTVDKLFINLYLGEAEVGIYSIASYFAVLISLPGRSVAKIATPFIAEAWKENDRTTIKKLYVRSSISMTAVGLLVFTGLLANLDNIFRLLPDAYGGGALVIILISLGNLAGGSASVNGVILGTSALYRYQTWLMLILIALFIITSMFFIPSMGINGAALAAMASNIIFTILGVVFVGSRFSLWPYRMVHLKMLAVSLGSLAAGYLLPQIPLIADIVIRSAVVTLIFVGGVWFWRLSDDLNGIIATLLERLRRS